MSSFAFQMDAFAYYFHCYVFKIDEKELLLLLFLFKKAQKKEGVGHWPSITIHSLENSTLSA